MELVLRRVRRRTADLGGPGQLRAVAVLAAVLALNSADSGAVSATTGDLERAFRIGNTQAGLLLTVVSIVGALATLPAGALTDRLNRTRMLAVSVVLWCVGMGVSGAVGSYVSLLVARVGLGAVLATAGPAVASLTGDFFPAAERGRIYGVLLAGELVGTGIGFVVSGELAAALSWRFAFLWLIVPGAAVAYAVWRLPEPRRGGARDRDEGEARRRSSGRGDGGGQDAEHGGRRQAAGALVREAGVEPREQLVLRSDGRDRSLWWVVRYALRVPTNVVLIIASALGYFFFAGLRSFAVLYATGQYGLPQSVATLLVLVVGVGAVAGILTAGRLADGWMRRGHLTARVTVPAASLLAVPLFLAPAVVVTSAWLAVPLLTGAALFLAAPNPPLDAARLDIMPPGLWGRAEGVRSVLRTLGEGVAPTLFGFVSQYGFGAPAASGGGSGDGGTASPAMTQALEYTFLLFLLPLVLAGVAMLFARRTYPRDAATAAASVAAARGGGGGEDDGNGGRDGAE